MLHLWYKSSYFHKAGWPREWITTAEDLLRNEWNVNYKPKTIQTVMIPAAVMHLYSICIYMKYTKLTSSLYRLCHLETNILIASKHSTLCLQVMQLMNGSILLQFQILLMVCNTGQPWLRAGIPWHQWQRIFCPSQVCYSLCKSIYHAQHACSHIN